MVCALNIPILYDVGRKTHLYITGGKTTQVTARGYISEGNRGVRAPGTGAGSAWGHVQSPGSHTSNVK